jgi:hypothetical protein
MVRTVTSKFKPVLNSISQRVNSIFKPSAAPKPPAASGKPLELNGATCNSFVPGTLVLLADGSAKPIQDIALGDQVQAVDPETSELGARRVSALISGTGEKTLVTVTTAQGKVVATEGHLFWNPESHAWVTAGDLVVGDALLLLDGTTSAVIAVSTATAESTVYNITVADLHTYYVLFGDTPVLVHNCPTGAPSGGGTLWTSTNSSTSAQNAFSHFGAHGADFPSASNALQYVDEAQTFLRTPPSGTLTTIRTNGDIVRYNPTTNNFGVMDAASNPRTFFKPDPAVHGYPTNMDYFNAQ